MSLPYKPASLIHVKRPWCHYHYKLSTNSCFISVTVIRWRLAWIFGEVVVGREREVLTTLTHSSPQIAPPSAGWGAGEKWKAGDARWWHDDPVMFDKIPQTFIDIKDKYQALFKTTVHWAGSFLSNTFLLLDLYEFIACKMCVKNAGYNFQQKKLSPSSSLSSSSPSSSLSSKNEIWINWPDERFHSDKWAEEKYDPRNSTQRDVDGDNDLSVV